MLKTRVLFENRQMTIQISIVEENEITKKILIEFQNKPINSLKYRNFITVLKKRE
jgi:hypothetical protein